MTEDHYEGILTHNRTVAEDLSLHVGVGGEYSTLAQSGPGGLEARGNNPSARHHSIDWRTTFELGHLSWSGAKLDTVVVYTDSSLTDPLTGVDRPSSGQTDLSIGLDLRHDIRGSNWAWGAGLG